jgi:hypothetical protein
MEQELKILELSRKALQEIPQNELDLIRSEAAAYGIEGPTFCEYLALIDD